jgi:hypothetical protein
MSLPLVHLSRDGISADQKMRIHNAVPPFDPSCPLWLNDRVLRSYLNRTYGFLTRYSLILLRDLYKKYWICPGINSTISIPKPG